MSTLAERIKRARTAKGLTLRGLAHLSGVSPAYLSNLESGRQANPTLGKLRALAHTLGTTPAALLGAEEDTTP